MPAKLGLGLAVPAFPSHTTGRKIGHSVQRASATKPRSLTPILRAVEHPELQLPVRSFKTPGTLFHSCRHSSTKTSNPLRILFCGSDEFSIASLRAIHNEHLRNPKTIASIDVVHRPGKRTGRGLKLIREVPIKQVTQELKLSTHEIDTFTGWKPPVYQNEPINLIVAVSFGLFVPPRILNGAKYGGLNVHPSLLPDLRGPAPIHHTLLQRRQKTGITLQTLHPKHFDQGMILAQTPYPGLNIPNSDMCTPGQLLDFLAPLGGQMLVETLRNRVFVPPLEDVGWYGKNISEAELEDAPKIQKEDSHIDWGTWTADEILLRSRVLGDLWDNTTWWKSISDKGIDHTSLPSKRTIFHGFEEWQNTDVGKLSKMDDSSLYLATRENPPKILRVTGCTVEGGRKGTGSREIIANMGKFAASDAGIHPRCIEA